MTPAAPPPLNNCQAAFLSTVSVDKKLTGARLLAVTAQLPGLVIF